MIGTLIGHYRVIDRLGEGGMGVVFRAVDTMLERDVALKMLHRSLTRDPARLERFRVEAVTLAKLHHPNIATLYGFQELQGDYVMIMEFVDGETFEAMLRRGGRIPIRQSLEIFCQALEGIAHAHSRRIIHRDIKPSNLLLNTAGVVKITDFGIARVLGGERITRTGTTIGTPEYMSPDQILGKELDVQSDIYSLGVLLFEMLTGKVPFSSTSEYELMRAHVEVKPPDIRHTHLDVPASLEAALHKALSKQPEDRFQTAIEFRDTLLAIAQSLPLDRRELLHAPESTVAPQVPPPVLERVSATATAVSASSSTVESASRVGSTERPVAPGSGPIPARLRSAVMAAGIGIVVFGAVLSLFVRSGKQSERSAVSAHNMVSNSTVSTRDQTRAGQPEVAPVPSETTGRKPGIAGSDTAPAQIPTLPAAPQPDRSTRRVSDPEASRIPLPTDLSGMDRTPVRQTKRETEHRSIPFSTRRQYSSTLPAGRTKVLQQGHTGVKQVDLTVVTQNGHEIARTVVGKRMVVSPTDQVILVGTGNREPQAGSRTAGPSVHRATLHKYVCPQCGATFVADTRSCTHCGYSW